MLYDEDLAHTHDAGFAALGEHAARAVVDLLRARGIERGTVVDAGCGSGRSARLLARAGYDVLGIDSSPAMIALARRNAPGARFRTEPLHTAELPGCVAVTAFNEVLNYPAEPPWPFFRRAAAALEPRGLLVCDLLGPGAVPGGGPVRLWSAGDDWAVLVEKAEQDRILTRRITVFRRAGEAWRRSDEEHRVRLYPPAEVLRELRAAGFRARARRAYPGVAPVLAHRVFLAGG